MTSVIDVILREDFMNAYIMSTLCGLNNDPKLPTKMIIELLDKQLQRYPEYPFVVAACSILAGELAFKEGRGPDPRTMDYIKSGFVLNDDPLR